MKRNRWKAAGKFVLILLIIAALFTLLFLLLDLLLTSNIEPFYNFVESVGRLFITHKPVAFAVCLLIVCAFASIIMVIVWWISARQTNKKIKIILNSIDDVFEKSDQLIHLPGEFRDTENKLNSIKYEAIRSEQMAKEAEQRKNDLVVYLAHDLKTPLTSVIGYLTLLNEEQEISPEFRQKYLEISLKKACRLEELINEFFDITRFNLQNIHLNRTYVHLSMMLMQLVDEFYPTLSAKNLRCNLQVDDAITIYADADKIARAFDNLLRNAVAYSTPNTTIHISARKGETRVVLVFENQGKRIPKEKLNSIFEKFYRLDDSRSSQTGGAGLGLAIAKEIIELHQGSISASSDEHSTQFTIVLPIRTPPSPTLESARKA